MLHEPATTHNFPKPYYLHLVLMTLDIGDWELTGLVTFHFIRRTRIILWHEVLFLWQQIMQWLEQIKCSSNFQLFTHSVFSVLSRVGEEHALTEWIVALVDQFLYLVWSLIASICTVDGWTLSSFLLRRAGLEHGETDLVQLEMDTDGICLRKQPARLMPFAVHQEVAWQFS